MKDRTTVLRGVTWDHDRGVGPHLATAAAYADLHPEVRVEWTTRSLQAFADQPVDQLAERFDLVVLDHPSIGYAVARGCLVPLDEHLETAFLRDQAVNSVGRSDESYRWAGHRWGLAVDAAAQVGAYRPDLLARLGSALPDTWDEVMTLADATRWGGGSKVAIPLVPVDALMSFFSICAGAGEEPFGGGAAVVDRTAGRHALQTLLRLRKAAHPESLSWNPPGMLERMATTDEVALCPLAFGYSNYARPGYRPNLIRFAGAPRGEDGAGSGTLGGAGLAVSRRSANVGAACAYAAYVADPEIQRTVYFLGGGQPGHRTAWTDPGVNAASTGFFAETLESLDRAYLRPRHDGYLAFQDRGGELIHRFLREGGDPEEVLDRLDEAAGDPDPPG